MKSLKIGCQIVLLIIFSELGNEIGRLFHLSAIPGSMIGLLILFILLELKVIKLEWVSLGGEWLVSNMLVFFVPAAVGIIQYGPLVRMHGLALVLVIAVSTALVMLSTGIVSEQLNNWKQKGETKHA